MEHTIYYHIKKTDEGTVFQFIGLNDVVANSRNKIERKFVELNQQDFTEKMNQKYGMLFATPIEPHSR